MKKIDPILFHGQEIASVKFNAEKVWKSSWNKEEVERARRFLIMCQRREWLFQIRRETVQLGLLEKDKRRINRETGENAGRIAKRSRIEELRVHHKICYDVLGYEDDRWGDEFSVM